MPSHKGPKGSGKGGINNQNIDKHHKYNTRHKQDGNNKGNETEDNNLDSIPNAFNKKPNKKKYKPSKQNPDGIPIITAHTTQQNTTSSVNEDNDLQTEIADLKKIVNQQRNMLKKLEEKTKKLSKRENMLEDAVNDLYDYYDDYFDNMDEDTIITSDGIIIKTIEGDELGGSKNLLQILGIDSSDDEDFEPSDNAMSDDTEISDDEYNNAADQLAMEEAKELLSKPSKKPKKNTSPIHIKSQKKDKNTTDDNKGKRHNKGRKSHNNIKITNKKKEMDDMPPILRNMIKKSLQKTNPTQYINDICDKKNISKKNRKELLKHAIEYLELCKKEGSINGEGESQLTDLDHFINSEPDSRRKILSNMKTMVEGGTMNPPAPYKFRIIASSMDPYTKQIALYKANQLENIQPGTGEYYKLKTWLDTLLGIPWGKYHALNVQSNEISTYLYKARDIMDKVIYGQEETKDIIIQIISKLLSNPDKCGNVFAIYGPPGVGKTTIIKEGMSKALGIPFSFISLGGATDSSYLDGHGYTYEGSMPGKIVEIIKQVGCLNPIIYFDELDKISSTRKGEEVSNLLVHLTDRSQNTLFQDKYLGNIAIDLSKAIYVFSFNDITKVNPILLDRMELIYVKGFKEEEKMVITRDYLLPELMHTYNLDTGHGTDNKQPFVEFNDENIRYIIKYGESNPEPHSQVQDLLQLQGLSSNTTNNKADNKDEGVRQIKRRIEKICSQLNIVKITGGNWEMPIHSTLDNMPELRNRDETGILHLDNSTIDKLLKIKSTQILNDGPPSHMYS